MILMTKKERHELQTCIPQHIERSGESSYFAQLNRDLLAMDDKKRQSMEKQRYNKKHGIVEE
jgi:hypothetical protein